MPDNAAYVEPMPSPVSYVIDVCRHCGRLAVWPGCEHWQSHAGWTMSVRVTLPKGERTRLERAMADAR